MRKTVLFLAAALTIVSCDKKPKLIPADGFNSVVDGKNVALYTLKGGDVTLQVTNFGGRVVSLFTQDRKGEWENIVVGHDNLQDYVTPPGERFLGACVGPVANRIGKGRFSIGDETCQTPLNNNGNTLHGGFKGLDMVVWDVVSANDSSIVLHYLHPDGDEGFPGNLDITMTYSLDCQGDFHVDYSAVTDKTTPVNISHHPFFCLRGQGNGSVEEYEMYIKSSTYTPVDSLAIPTGEIAPVEGTPFDFRRPHAIGQLIAVDDTQLRYGRGYDHNWCIDKETEGIELVCRVTDPVSGRYVEVLSDQPGLQFYSGNFFEGGEKGSNGNVLEFRSSLALEAQKYPDSVNHDNFTPTLLSPGETYTQSTIYRFGAVPEWAPAGEHFRTAWADEVSPSNVHPEYPRPQLIRPEWQSLNGLWNYAIAPACLEQPAFFDGKILVPFCAESSLSGVGKMVGPDSALWYKTSFSVPAGWKEKKVLLHFDAVDWKTEVWLNGKPMGEHTGGYTAFEFDITDALVQGKQELVLKVWDGTDNDQQPRGKQVSHPHSIWYTPVTGIWQSVWLEPVGKAFLKDYNCTGGIAGNITLTANVEGEADAVAVTLYEGGEGWDAEHGKPGKKLATAQTEPGKALVLNVPDAKLWSPEHPYLYALSIEVVKDGKVLDKARAYTAIRSCTEVIDAGGHKRLGLNGKPCFQYGPLDQGWWPDGLYTAPTDEALAYDIIKTKEWGYNFIRKHIKIEPARWYYHCDRLGMMVWQDMPSMAGNINNEAGEPQWGRKAYGTGWDYPLSETAKATYYKEWGEILGQLKKFPCIVVWVPFNEGWGQFDTEKAVDFTREQDPSRLVNSASGGNHRHCGDILDSHNYPKPKMLLRSDGEQIDVVGEYGGIGYAVAGHTWQAEGNWGYKGKCENGEQVLEKYRHYAEEYLIPSIADGIAAAVYTQTTDVEVEVNGLMTYDRKVIKIDEAKLREVNLKVIESLQE